MWVSFQSASTANRLEQFGVCRFVYAFSRFQGEGAAREIGDALQKAMASWGREFGGQPDAVVSIRGGGAVNDLAWLNDYDLARLICDLPVPVLTGIGHERDSTVLDEVANAKYDTPSKVIAGIEQVIVKRAAEAKAYFEQVTNRASMTVQSVKAKTFELDATVRSESIRHLAMGMQASQELINGIRLNAIQDIRTASEATLEALQGVKSGARQQMAQAKQDVPLYWGQVSQGIKHALRSASVEVDVIRDGVFERAQRDVARARVDADDAMLVVGTSAKRLVREGASASEALMREIAGQGPEKTLSRGFALVRDQVGKPITRAQQTTNNAAIEIQFFDGKVAATVQK